MIESLKINYQNGVHPMFSWLDLGDNRYLLPDSFQFNEGLNVIIGTNGCGKSTLLKILSSLSLVDGLPLSFMLWEKIKIYFPYNNKDTFLTPDYKKIQNFFDMKINFDAPTSIMNENELFNIQNNYLNNINNFALALNQKQMSKGERMVSAINNRIKHMNEYSKNFSIKKLIPDNVYANDTYVNAFDEMRNLITKINSNELPKRATFFMDEPDEGLDIFRIKDLRDFLVRAKEKSQLIVIMHNPLLIKYLSSFDDVNFIELTDGYLDEIKNF